MSTHRILTVRIGRRAWSELQLLNPPDDEPQMAVIDEAARTVTLRGSLTALMSLEARAEAMIECLHGDDDAPNPDYPREALKRALARMREVIAGTAVPVVAPRPYDHNGEPA